MVAVKKSAVAALEAPKAAPGRKKAKNPKGSGSEKKPTRAAHQKIDLSAAAQKLKRDLERETGLRVLFRDPERTRTYNREYMRVARGGSGKSRGTDAVTCKP